MTTIEATRPQHLQALELADRTRKARAELRRWIAAPAGASESRARAAEVLAAPPWEAESMTVFRLLTSVRRSGRQSVRRQLRAAGGISEERRIRELTARQRHVLAAVVGAATASNPAALAHSAAIVDRLWRAGLREDGLPGWWRTRRTELGGETPRQALCSRPRVVIDLAESDAVAIARDVGRHS